MILEKSFPFMGIFCLKGRVKQMCAEYFYVKGEKVNERRKQDRIPVNSEVSCQLDESMKAQRQDRKLPEHQIQVTFMHHFREDGWLVDFSTGGFQVVTGMKLNRGERVYLIFKLPVPNVSTYIMAECEVRWQDCKTDRIKDNCCDTGLKILEMFPEHFEILNQYYRSLPQN